MIVTKAASGLVGLVERKDNRLWVAARVTKRHRSEANLNVKRETGRRFTEQNVVLVTGIEWDVRQAIS